MQAIAGFQKNKRTCGVCIEVIPQRVRNLQWRERWVLVKHWK